MYPENSSENSKKKLVKDLAEKIVGKTNQYDSDIPANLEFDSTYGKTSAARAPALQGRVHL